MSKFLTTIRTDVPLDVDWNAFARGELDAEKVAAVCAKYELNTLAKRLLGTSAAASAKTGTYTVGPLELRVLDRVLQPFGIVL